MNVVTLSWPEIFLAADVGLMRNIINIRKGRKHNHGYNGIGWDIHIEGACGELAVAKYFNVFWSGNVGNINGGDVGKFEVRMSKHQNARLILHPADDDDAIFILVTGSIPQFEIVGWILARNGKIADYWCDPSGNDRPAFFVPQQALNTMETFPL